MKSGVAVTIGGNLRAKAVIHLDVYNNDNKIKKVRHYYDCSFVILRECIYYVSIVLLSIEIIVIYMYNGISIYMYMCIYIYTCLPCSIDGD